MTEVYHYPNCSTSKKAVKFLEDHGIPFVAHDIVKHTPSAETLRTIMHKADITVDRLFNTSGRKYRELDMKNRKHRMSENEKLELLSAEGMLIKRPLVMHGEDAIVGFNASDYKTLFNV